MSTLSDSLKRPEGGTGPRLSPARLSPARVSPARLSTARLGQLVAGVARHPGRWLHLVRYEMGRRWYHRMELTDSYEVWLLSWQPGQGTGFHDHGGSSGAFAVAIGELQEQLPGRVGGLDVRAVAAGQVRSFGARFVHHVVNNSLDPAVSVHAYSPPLPWMRRYELTVNGLRYTGTEPPEEGLYRLMASEGLTAPARVSIDQLLAQARKRLRRVGPLQAAEEMRAGALLVDIRPAAQRAAEGEVPGALTIERNVLEWRLDPASDSRLPQAGSYDLRVIIMCSESYTSSLAAASLQDLGLVHATDLEGGFRAWAAAGLPVTGPAAASRGPVRSA